MFMVHAFDNVNYCILFMMDHLLLEDDLDESNQEPSLKSIQSVDQFREKAKLENRLLEAQRQIKRLHHSMQVNRQKENNNIAYFQGLINQLQADNRQLARKLEEAARQSDKVKRTNHLYQTKMNSSKMVSSARCQKQNCNTLNLVDKTDDSNCPNLKCRESAIQQQKVEQELLSFDIILQNLIVELKFRITEEWSIQDFAAYKKEMGRQSQANQYQHLNTLQTMKHIQKSLEALKEGLKWKPNWKKKEALTNHRVLQKFLEIKERCGYLNSIPFVQEIDLEAKEKMRMTIRRQALGKEREILGQLEPVEPATLSQLIG